MDKKLGVVMQSRNIMAAVGVVAIAAVAFFGYQFNEAYQAKSAMTEQVRQATAIYRSGSLATTEGTNITRGEFVSSLQHGIADIDAAILKVQVVDAKHNEELKPIATRYMQTIQAVFRQKISLVKIQTKIDIAIDMTRDYMKETAGGNPNSSRLSNESLEAAKKGLAEDKELRNGLRAFNDSLSTASAVARSSFGNDAVISDDDIKNDNEEKS